MIEGGLIPAENELVLVEPVPALAFRRRRQRQIRELHTVGRDLQCRRLVVGGLQRGSVTVDANTGHPNGEYAAMCIDPWLEYEGVAGLERVEAALQLSGAVR
ncbi:MAG: hypothetical protein WCP30_17810 [Mycobacteriaceae bacterium]